MDAALFTIVKSLVIIAFTAFGAYLLPVIKGWIATLLQNKWAADAVQAAQQMAELKGDNEGKLEFASKQLFNLCSKYGIKITEEQIRALVESAVFEMKKWE